MTNCKKCGREIELTTGDTSGLCNACKYTILQPEIISDESNQVDCRVINTIACFDVLPDAPVYNEQIQSLHFSYKNYYVEVKFDIQLIGYMDCKSADSIKTEKDFKTLCNRFAKHFYRMLSNYMSF